MSPRTSRLCAALLLFLPLVALAAGPMPMPPMPVASGSWRWLQPRPTGANLRDVAFADAHRGFAVGAGGTVLRTTDGGASWELRPTPQGRDLAAVSANGPVVVAVGAGATILRSTDGGDSFTQVGWPLSSSQPDLVDVQLLDAANGFVLAADGTLLGSSDGFRTLSIKGRITFGQPKALWFASPTKGWVVGVGPGRPTGFVAQTLDGGRSFNQVFTAPGGGFLAVAGFAVAPDASVVVAAGTMTPNTVSFDESQPGSSWGAADVPGGKITALSILLDAARDGEFWAAGSDGLFGARFNNNQTQSPLTQGRPRLWSVASPAFGTAIAVGDGGSIVRATYGGGPAQVVAGNRQETFVAAAFPGADGQFGVFADNQPGVPQAWVTRNGGASLTSMTNATAPIAAMAFVDAQNGFGALESGDFYATTDGGATWTRRSSVTFRARSVAFMDARQGYLAGDGGLFFTLDGGLSWRPAPTAAAYVAVAVNGAHAAALSANGNLYRRDGTDVSAPWALVQSSGPDALLSCLALFDDGRMAACVRSTGKPGVVIVGAGASGVSLPRSPTALAVANGRLFALLEGGTLGEVQVAPGGAFLNPFESNSDLRGLVSRVVTGAAGSVRTAPMAFGDFGALLVFDDLAMPPPPPPPPNQPPQVFVFPPVLQLAVGQVGLVGAKALDPEGQPLTYRWSDPNNAGLSFGAPDQPQTEVKWGAPPPPGTKAAARVTVCDPQNACTTADVIVDAGGSTTGNRPPVAVATGVAVETGQPIILDGSGSSDPDGDPLTYQWTQLTGTPVQLQGSRTDPLLVADAPGTAGILVFELRVCDPANACARIEVTVAISLPNMNSAPVAATKGDLTVPAGAPFSLDATDSFDPEDGQVASVSWRQASGPTRPLAGATLSIATSLAGAAGDKYRFIVRVCDLQNACSEAGMNVTVDGAGPVNQPPKVVVPQPQQAAKVGDRVTLSALATDPEGQPVKVSWQDGQPALRLGLQQTGPTDAGFTVPAGAAGQTLKFVVTACDPQNACATATAAVQVAALPGLAANAGPDQSVGPGATVVLDGSGSTGAVATWAWTQVAGPAVALQGASSVRCTFVAPPSSAALTLRLTVTSADGRTASDDVAVVVTGPAIPIADAGLDLTVGFGARVQLDGRRTRDPQHRPLTYAWTGPAGVAVSGADALLAVFYAPARDARLEFTLTVCAAADLCGTDTVLVTVQKDANLPPLPDAGPDRRAQGGSTLVLDGTRSLDPENGRLTAAWHVRGGDAAIAVPDALWTQVQLPDVAVETLLTFELQVCDVEGACAVDTATVDVLPSGPGAPEVRAAIDGHPDGAVDEQAEFTVSLEVRCPATPCADAGQLRLLSGPPLSRVGATGWRFATPMVSRAVPFSFEASVCDLRGRCAAATLEGLVRDTVDEAPVAVPGADQEVRRRQLVVLDGSGSYDPNGDALEVTWRQRTGRWPAQLSGASLLRPRFTVPVDAPLGLMTFELEACDSRGACSTASAGVTVLDGEPANRPPLAEAGDDLKGRVGAHLDLDGRRSFDPDGDALTYRWTVPGFPAARLINADQAQAQLIVPAVTPADPPIVVRLEVCDPSGACSADELSVVAWEQPVDDAAPDVHFDKTTRACGCAGEPASFLGLFGLLGATWKRRRTG